MMISVLVGVTRTRQGDLYASQLQLTLECKVQSVLFVGGALPNPFVRFSLCRRTHNQREDNRAPASSSVSGGTDL